MWDNLGYAKLALWEDRVEVVGRRVRVKTPSQVFRKFRSRVAERVRVDGVVHGRVWVGRKWGGLDSLFKDAF